MAKHTVLSDLNRATPSVASTTPSAGPRWQTSHPKGVCHEQLSAAPYSPTA
jgi:hypothetical protein